MAIKRLRISMIIVCLSAAVFVACNGEADGYAEDNSNSRPLKIYASFFVLADFAQKIGGDAVEVHTLIPPGVEAHDFEPTPKRMIALGEADVFVYNGGGFEAWAEKAADTLDGKNTRIINTAEALGLVNGGSDDHAGGLLDPHIWLDPHLAEKQAAAIKDALVTIDPDNAQAYEKNFNEFAEQIAALDEKISQTVETAKRNEIIVSHAAFGHLAERYDLVQIAVSGNSPAAEPSQKELQAVIEFAKAHDVRYILYEPFVSSKVADVVRKEIGAEALTLHPLENVSKEDLERGEDYFSIMEKNVQHLEKALR